MLAILVRFPELVINEARRLHSRGNARTVTLVFDGLSTAAKAGEDKDREAKAAASLAAGYAALGNGNEGKANEHFRKAARRAAWMTAIVARAIDKLREGGETWLNYVVGYGEADHQLVEEVRSGRSSAVYTTDSDLILLLLLHGLTSAMVVVWHSVWGKNHKGKDRSYNLAAIARDKFNIADPKSGKSGFGKLTLSSGVGLLKVASVSSFLGNDTTKDLIKELGFGSKKIQERLAAANKGTPATRFFAGNDPLIKACAVSDAAMHHTLWSSV